MGCNIRLAMRGRGREGKKKENMGGERRRIR